MNDMIKQFFDKGGKPDFEKIKEFMGEGGCCTPASGSASCCQPSGSAETEKKSEGSTQTVAEEK